MSSQPAGFLTPAAYLEIERRAERKSKYFQGEMFAMAGATREHILIVGNLMLVLLQQLRPRDCEVYSNDMRLQVSATGLYTYPDVLVVCGEPRFVDERHDTLLNPTVAIEVLSESIQDYDRGRKFEHYRTLSSLADYLTIAQDRPHIEHWTRQEDHGRFTEYKDLSQTIQLASIDAILPLSEIYRKLNFPKQSAVL